MDFFRHKRFFLNELKDGILQAMHDTFRINNDLLMQEIRASEYRVKTELR